MEVLELVTVGLRWPWDHFTPRRLFPALSDVYSRMDTWRGHFPITNFVLRALLKKQAAADGAGFSRAEAVLFAACRFWAAAATRELAAYLAPEPVPVLLVAFEAFSELGAVRVASALRVALADRPEAPSAAWLRLQAVDLETRLLDTEDAVDQLIAQFASEHLRDDSVDRQSVVSSARPGLAG